MNNTQKLIIASFTALLLTGCAMTTSKFDINVGGDSAFSGSIMVIRDGKSLQRSVDGQAPTSFIEEGSLVSVSFQKKATKGSLSVTIKKDGQQAATQSTSADYGVVTAATQ